MDKTSWMYSIFLFFEIEFLAGGLDWARKINLVETVLLEEGTNL